MSLQHNTSLIKPLSLIEQPPSVPTSTRQNGITIMCFVSRDEESHRHASLTGQTRFIILCLAILAGIQLMQSIRATLPFERLQLDFSSSKSQPQDNNEIVSSLPRLSKEDSFGACLMIKEDNDLLWEWLAYHYTVLPLRYVFVGSDEGNLQNPNDVLQRYTNAETDLQYWIVNATDFAARHGNFSSARLRIKGNASDPLQVAHEVAHHAFVHRQRGFITTCLEFMKAKGLHWITLIDTDEFLVMNRIRPWEHNSNMQDTDTTRTESNSTNDIFGLRPFLPSIQSNRTVLDSIRTIRQQQELKPCYTMPRLLHGALENMTCPLAETAVSLAKKSYHFNDLSTLRFYQHARKDDFSKSKFGKVILDVSQLSKDIVTTQVPSNIHRPYKSECQPGASGNFLESLFYLNHYIGSWERYSAREDSRRNRREWQVRAFLTDDWSCEHQVHQWFPRFIDLVGEHRAKYLLGVTDSLY